MAWESAGCRHPRATPLKRRRDVDDAARGAQLARLRANSNRLAGPRLMSVSARRSRACRGTVGASSAERAARAVVPRSASTRSQHRTRASSSKTRMMGAATYLVPDEPIRASTVLTPPRTRLGRRIEVIARAAPGWLLQRGLQRRRRGTGPCGIPGRANRRGARVASGAAGRSRTSCEATSSKSSPASPVSTTESRTPQRFIACDVSAPSVRPCG